MSVAEIEGHQLELDASSGGGLWSEAVYRLSRNPSAIIGAFLVLMFVIAAIFAPVIAPYGPLDQNLGLLKAEGFHPGRRCITSSASTCSGATCSRGSSTAPGIRS
jgi:ABC-type dipeptide/oligopeptide/nickel transport system permease subunit